MEPLKILSPIHKATRQVDLYLAKHTSKLGLNNTEAHLVTYLLSYGPCPITETHRVFGLKRSTLTSMLDRLESRGLLCRKANPEDRRSFVINLTRKGKTVGQKLRDLVETFEEQVLRELTRSQINGFLKVMEAVDKVTEVNVRR